MNDTPAHALDRARWRKSSHSQGQTNCVEVATAAGWVGVRDSKLGADSPILTFTQPEWAAFIAGVKGNEFDL
ncbi:MAG: DUF397 domain-containing protein [Pseudonocardiales bacterium]|nr:DUF397 domain-containing protein [Pseudonocardiales bacterium]